MDSTTNNSEESGRIRSKVSLKRKFFRSLSVVVLIAALIAGYYGYQIYSATSKMTGDKNPLQLASLLSPGKLAETNGRINVLLAGYSIDDPGHQGAELTDSIMMVSINPNNHSADLISIPRDTWVDIPGYGYQKINAAYEDGGMALLEQIVDQDFGVQADYYGLLDYQAFEDAVDAVGGVTIDIQSPDSRGLYDPYTHLSLPNGKVTLDGQQALNLARARGDGRGAYGFPNGDFDRTAHQQQMLIALKQKADTASVYLDPVKVTKLISAVGDNLKTNLSLGDMLSLYLAAQKIDSSSVKSVTLDNFNGQDLFSDYYTPDGEDALIPAAGFDNFSQIRTTIQSLLQTGN